MIRVVRGRCLGALGFGACTERVAPALWLVALVACAATASPPGPAAATRRPSASDEPSVPLRPHVAVVPVDAPAPPPPPPPVIDAEQRAVLDALEGVAKALETPRTPAELAAALGTVVDAKDEDGMVEVAPRDAALTRVHVDSYRRPTENSVQVTVRTPTNAVILGTRFGVLIEAGLVPEFDDPYWLVTCRQLPDGASVSIEVMFDWVPKLKEAEPTSTVYLQRLPRGGCW